MTIKCVCFDLGGVFIGIDRAYVAKKYAPYSEYSEADICAILTHQASDNGLWEIINWFDRGIDLECSDYDFYLKFTTAMKLDRNRLDFWEFRRIYSSFVYPIPEMLALAKRIRGVRMGIISNLCRIHQSIIFKIIPRDLFDFAIFSFVEQEMKPDVPIYEIARRAAGVQYPEILFHDDRQENLFAAAKLGMYTCAHYSDRPAAVNVAVAEAVMRSLKISII